ncbi:aromatic ring-hydroxylating oxygenase subunit alpha [Amycolatopsis sp.]|uniref:aromatic ring-hydroxylating oxygenase subunit alpha n=1 Tax=Amycolatopsis sp. TaxID=37632 RepID=UPI002BA2C212|nr:Rieske 2Fe-2S domain-containing protein [Amycolatopsis sp.]HVV08132.1 Rieske 2Fe-2S domain-containing protein [Amycolatopsis sp.]
MPTVDQLVRADAVHRDIYRDPAVFELEMTRIFKRTWVYLAHESEVAEPGDYVTRTVGREPVVLVRGEDGVLRAVVNRCRHRAALVCEHETGNAKSFRCQYHGWTYRNDGRLIGVPHPERQSADVRERLGLAVVPRVESYRGLVFGSFNPAVSGLAEHLGPAALGYIDRFLDHCAGLPLTAHRQAHRITMPANWKLQLENGLDGYHAGFTHRSFFDVMRRRTGASVRFASGLPTATARAFRNGHTAIDPETTSRKPLIQRVSTLPGAAAKLDALRAHVGPQRFDEYAGAITGAGINVGIFPNLQLIGIHLRRIEPVSVDRTIVSVRPLLAVDAPPELNWLRLRYHELFYGPAGFGQPDDFEMFDRVAAGLADSEDGWLRFERGHGAETETEDGETIVGNVTDEIPQRGQYRQWRALLAGETA